MATAAQIQKAVADLQAEIQPLTDAKDGVLALIDRENQLIQDALNSGGAPDEALTQIQAITNAVKADRTAIADKIVANTPAA